MQNYKQILMPVYRMIGFAIFLFLTACITDDDTPDMINYVEVGDILPDFTIVEDNGETLKSTDFIGQVSVICFFNTGCSDCKREIPIIEKAWEVLKSEANYNFAMIARGQTTKETDTYWKEEGLSLPRYHDPDKVVFELFANSYVPRIYIINQKGIIKWMGIERFNLSSTELIEKVRMVGKDA